MPYEETMESMIHMVYAVVLFFVVLIAIIIIYLVYKKLKSSDSEEETPQNVSENHNTSNRDPLEVLKERYARGEITDAEYQRKREILLNREIES